MNEFVGGIRVFTPNEKTPDFIKFSGIINKAELLEWIRTQPSEIKFNVKESKKGGFYMAVDNWKKA